MLATMKAAVVQIDKTVAVEEKAVPVIGPNEVLLRVVSVGINPTDWKHAIGIAKPGAIIGCDFVGEVMQLGQSVPVKEFTQGELRWGFTRGGMSSERGGFAEYVAVEWDLTSVVPPNVTPQQAASIPIPFITAVQALYARLGIPEPPAKMDGQWFLVWSGATAVGRFAIQLAKLSGLKVATTASQSKWDVLKKLGADLCVDYKDPSVIEKLKEGTNDSIEYGLDCIYKDGTVKQSQLAFRPQGGHLITLGFFSSDDLPRPEVKTGLTLAYTALGVDQLLGKETFKASPEDRAMYVRWCKIATQLFAEGQITPLDVEVVGGLDSCQTALKKVQDGTHGGTKLVLNVA